MQGNIFQGRFDIVHIKVVKKTELQLFIFRLILMV